MDTQRDAIPHEQAREVQRAIDEILSSTGEGKRKAAEELRKLGVWTRGSVSSRGAADRAAAARLPKAGIEARLIECLGDAGSEVRGAVASALGEWGGADSAAALAGLLSSDNDPEVRLSCVAALRALGGPLAVQTLRHALETGGERVRQAALDGIEELFSCPQPDLTERYPTAATPIWGAAVQASGGPDPARELAATLTQISGDSSNSMYLRLRASELRDMLGR